MTWFHDLPPVLSGAIQTTLAVTLLVGIVLIIRRPFARRFGAKAAYALWLIPAVRFVMPPLPGNLSLFGLLGSQKPEAAAEPSQIVYSLPRVTEAATGAAESPVVRKVVERSETITVDTTASVSSAMSGIEQSTLNWPLLLTSLWIVGAVTLIGWAIWRQARFGWLIKLESEPASPSLTHKAEAVANEIGLKSRVDVRTSLLCAGPLVTGFLRPTVLLPAWFETDYTEEEQRQALIHEFMHVRRGDLISLQAASVILALQWFNPLVHLAMRAFRSDQEAACDADVLSRTATSPRAYGNTLVKTVRISTNTPHIAAAGLPLAHEIKERLILMQNPNPTKSRRLAGASLAAIVGAAGLALTATAGAPPAAPKAAAAPKAPTAPKSLTFVAAPAAPAAPQFIAFAGAPEAPEAPQAPKSKTVVVSGDDDLKVMILSNPMEGWEYKLQTEIEPRIRELEARMPSSAELEQAMVFAFDESGFAEVMASMPTLKLTKGDQVIEIRAPKIPAMALSGGDMGEFEVAMEAWGEEFGEQIMMIALDGTAMGPEFEAEMEAWGEEMEAWGEKMEAWGERFEAEMEVWEEEHERRAEVFEAEMEEWEEEFEAVWTDEFEDGLEAAADDLEELVEQCEDADKGPSIASVRGADGKTYRALCLVDVDYSFNDQRVANFVSSRNDLSAAERSAYEDQRGDLLGGRND